MGKVFLSVCLFLFTTMGFAQTQKGYVKTKGHLDDGGNLIPGVPIGEVVVKVKGRNDVMSDKKGNFSFLISDKTYNLENVTKNGYILTDPDVLLKQYSYSSDKLVIAMETYEDQMEERMLNFTKINAAQNEMIIKLREEIKKLKADNKITEEEYYKRLQEVVDIQDENLRLVDEMVEKYSKIDYDQLSEFDRKISAFILKGELHRADSLLKTKGDLDTRAENLKKLNEANAKERDAITKRSRKLEKNEALALQERDDLANDYYHKFEIMKMQHKNDSAAYYLEQRAMLDTTRIEWMIDVGCFVRDYLAQYDKACYYLDKALNISLNANNSKNYASALSQKGLYYKQIGEYDEALKCFNQVLEIAKDWDFIFYSSYKYIGDIYYRKGEFNEAIKYQLIALDGFVTCYGENNCHLGSVYSGIGINYLDLGNYFQAIEYLNKALNIDETFQQDASTVYNLLGATYAELEEYDKAKEYVQKTLKLRLSIYGDAHPLTATTFNNIGYIYVMQDSLDKAVYFFDKTSNVEISIYGENSIKVTTIYNNIGTLYYKLGDSAKAIMYYNKALNIRRSVLGEIHPDVAILYNNIGYVYNDDKEYVKSLEYYEKALKIYKQYFEENHPEVARSYNNIGYLYYDQEDYKKALEYMEKAFLIYDSLYGEDNLKTQKTKKVISDIKQKLKESSKK